MSPWCKSCDRKSQSLWRSKNKGRKADMTRKWRAANLESVRARELRWKRAHREHRSELNRVRIHSQYGYKKGDYERMLAEQGGVCAICRSDDPGPKGRFHVDHCHATLRMRALLCSHCNGGLGLFRDSTIAMRRAAEYVGIWAARHSAAGLRGGQEVMP